MRRAWFLTRHTTTRIPLALGCATYYSSLPATQKMFGKKKVKAWSVAVCSQQQTATLYPDLRSAYTHTHSSGVLFSNFPSYFRRNYVESKTTRVHPFSTCTFSLDDLEKKHLSWIRFWVWIQRSPQCWSIHSCEDSQLRSRFYKNVKIEIQHQKTLTGFPPPKYKWLCLSLFSCTKKTTQFNNSLHSIERN